MGRASDLTIRGVFLPWSDWNIEGPPYVDLPLEERAQLVFSTLFGSGPNGVRAVPVSPNGSLSCFLLPSTGQSQSVTHAVNTITLPAAGNGLRNVLTYALMSIRGTGTAPTQAAPLSIQVKDGNTVIHQLWGVGFALLIALNLTTAGLAGSVNTPMSISMADPGAGNSTDINVGSYIA